LLKECGAIVHEIQREITRCRVGRGKWAKWRWGEWANGRWGEENLVKEEFRKVGSGTEEKVKRRISMEIY
jgi:hypothetical protein